MRNFVIAIIATLMFASIVGAQEEPCLRRLLVPITAKEVPGAYGSVWQTFLTVTNHGEESVAIDGIFSSCVAPPCQSGMLAPDTTATPRVHDDYLTVGCDAAKQVDVSLRVRDLSRTTETWGTSIPVVWDDDAFHGETIGITDIPNGEGFRSMLRIYTFDEGVTESARVQVYQLRRNTESNDLNEDLLLADFVVVLVPEALDPFHTPGYAQILLSSLPEVASAGGDLRVEVSGSDQVGLWAMVSTTANETQFVTILTPR